MKVECAGIAIAVAENAGCIAVASGMEVRS